MTRRFRYKDIQLPQLRSFCVVATQGSFSTAARLLGLSAPTVWEQVRGLERHLGATLLLRRGRQVELTNEGRLLLDLVQPHVHGLDSLEKLFTAQRLAGLPNLTIASSPSILVNYLVQPVQEFARAYPSVRIHLRPSVRIEDGLRLLERGQADVGLLAFLPGQVANSVLQVEPLFELRLVLVTALSHPLAKKRRVTLADVVAQPLILQHEGTYSRQAVNGLLVRQGLLDQVRIVMESSHADVIRAYVEAGLGISLFYGTADAPTLKGLHCRIFDPRLDGLPVCLLQRRGSHASEPVQAFQRIARRCLRDHRHTD